MNSIVGRWKDAYYGQLIYEFFEDGTYTYEDNKGPDVSGTYSISDNNLITKSNLNPNTSTRKFTVSGDDLSITNPASGVTGEYVRVK